MNFEKFNNKYIITGTLKGDLHIGSGNAAEDNAPFIRYENGIAYIPGSSFRGHLRSKLEGLTELGLQVDNEDLDELHIKGLFGYTNLEEKEFNTLLKRNYLQKKVKKDEELKKYSSMMGKIHIADLVIVHNKKDVTRDGIAIDRNTGTTKNSAKFDYNIIEQGEFKFNITLDNVENYELDLVNIGLNLMKNDIFGGKTSRGIGQVELKVDAVKYVEKSDLKNYLFSGTMKEGNQSILAKEAITL